MLAIAVVFVLNRLVVSCDESKCNETSSVPNVRLVGLVFLKRRAENMNECVMECDKQAQCGSVNFKLMDSMCELNKASVHIAPHRYIPANGYVYSDNPWPKIKLVSMSSIASIGLYNNSYQGPAIHLRPQ